MSRKQGVTSHQNGLIRQRPVADEVGSTPAARSPLFGDRRKKG